ncbi:unnamed protein product, partial [Brassica oleracea]
QNPAGTSPEQPQIATMKEKSSHHPRKERLELSRHVLGEQKNDRSNMSISKLNFEIGSANSQLHQRFTVDTEGTRKQERYHWKDLDA